MNKKLAHSIILFLDLLSLFGLSYAYHEVKRILIENTNEAAFIEFGNRFFFIILVLIVPIGHILAIVEHLNAEFIKKYNRSLNYGVILAFMILLASGFFGSYWIKSRVENSGYIYCRNASGISALAKTLVYTKSMNICEELVESKRKRRK
jgi:heme A synthase